MNREDLLAALIVLAAKAGTRTFGIFNEDRVMLVRHGYLLALEELASEVGFHERAREDAEAAAKEDEGIGVRTVDAVYQDPFVDEAERLASRNRRDAAMNDVAKTYQNTFPPVVNYQEPKHSENCDCSKCVPVPFSSVVVKNPFQDPIINEEEK